MPRDAELGSGSTDARLESELRALHAESLHRQLVSTDPRGFCSNDYLGLAHHPALVRTLRSSIDESERIASTGSRLLSGHAPAWDRLEDCFARFVGSEACLFFNSGYAANIGLLTSVVRREDTVYSDSANHASLIDGIRLARCRKVIFPHLDMDFLEDALARDAARDGERFIVVESIFSMDGDSASIEALHSLATHYGANLIVDEAHATGVVGKAGRGLTGGSDRPESVLASVHTCGKALASAGAFVACSSTLKDYLINFARTFIFSTALPPYVAAQVGEAIHLAAAADPTRQRLAATSDLLRTRLKSAGFDTGRSNSQIVPVLLGSNENALVAARQLNAAGYSVRAIRPPTVPAGTSRLRLTVTAETSTDMVNGLVDALVERNGRA